MTDTKNGWPGEPGVPMNPEQSGWHWLKGAASLSKPRPYLWEVFLGSGRWADERLNDPVILAEMEYIRPALPYGLTPDEAQNLRDDLATTIRSLVAERDALKAENAGLSANQCLHDIHGDESGNLYCPRIAELEAAIHQYVNHVVSYEGTSFIDEMNEPPWAKLINDIWVKQAALGGEKDE